MKNTRVYRMLFKDIYPLYVQKAEKKGRTREEVNRIIFWMTGYSDEGLKMQLDKGVDFETFFAEAPQINENVLLIKGLICGYRVEEIEDELMKKIRQLDKLIDELSKGKSIEKILRTNKISE